MWARPRKVIYFSKPSLKNGVPVPVLEKRTGWTSQFSSTFINCHTPNNDEIKKMNIDTFFSVTRNFQRLFKTNVCQAAPSIRIDSPFPFQYLNIFIYKNSSPCRLSKEKIHFSMFKDFLRMKKTAEFRSPEHEDNATGKNFSNDDLFLFYFSE